MAPGPGPAYPPPPAPGPGPAQPPPGYSAGPAHAPRPGATTVGEYVDEVERGAVEPRHEYRPDPQGRP